MPISLTPGARGGVWSLVPLLTHSDLYVRESAGLALTGFRHINPRHLPALIPRGGRLALSVVVSGVGRKRGTGI